jgi:hypothetical protein
MKYTVVMVPSGMIYIPGFIKTGSGVQKLLAGDTHTNTTHTDSKVNS